MQDKLQKTFNAFVIVSLLTFFCFLPHLGNSLLDWDDSGYIYENRHIRSLPLDTSAGNPANFTSTTGHR